MLVRYLDLIINIDKILSASIEVKDKNTVRVLFDDKIEQHFTYVSAMDANGLLDALIKSQKST